MGRSAVIFCIFLVFSIYLTNAKIRQDEYKTIQTENGSVRGRLETTVIDQKPFYAFRGIPFASPPVGDLKFKPPKPPLPWDGVMDTFEFGNECVQRRYVTKTVSGHEDCLYLNVFVPAINVPEKTAVMIFIYPGAYQFGSGNGYGPDLLLNNDVIMVSFNYRLGPYGFLSLGTPEYSGNMGLKDQSAAIKWVNKNIEKFGGDVTKITVFGGSAGAAGVQYQAMTPVNKGLFQRIIMQSGSVLNPWAYYTENNHVNELYDIARKFGHNPQNLDDIITFINRVDPTVFILGSTPEGLYTPATSRKEHKQIWAPITEVPNAVEPILLKRPWDYLSGKDHYDLDVLLGYNSAETVFDTGTEYLKEDSLKPFDEAFELDLPRNDMLYTFGTKEYNEIAMEIRNFYFPNGERVNIQTFVEYNNMLSDSWRIYGIDASAKSYGKSTSGKVFYYLLSIETDLNLFKTGLDQYKLNVSGTSHGDEMFYLFDFSIESINFHHVYKNLVEGSPELNNIRLLTKMWTDFAKYGNPTPDNEPIQFNPILKDEINFVNITNDGLVMGIQPYKERIQFWDDLYVKYNHLFRKVPSIIEN